METDPNTVLIKNPAGQIEMLRLPDHANQILKGLTSLRSVCHDQSREAGFWLNGRNFAEAVLTAITELTDAVEDYRTLLPSDKIPDYKKVEEQLADAIIRIMDIGGGLNFDLPSAIVAKLTFNKQQIKPDSKNEKLLKSD